MKSLLVICVLAAVVRLAAAGVVVGLDTPAAQEPAADSRLHVALAESMLAGRGFAVNGAPTAVTPPLYVAFIAGIYALFGSPAAVRVVQALLGALACLLTYAIARRLLDARAALWAAAAMAVFPHAVYVSALHLTENLFLIALLLVVLQAARTAAVPSAANALGLGVLAALAALTRSIFLAFIPLLLIWAVCVWGVRGRTAWRVFAAIGVGAAVALGPWTVRNAVVLGAAVPVQSNGGMVFWAGNNPLSNGGLVWPDDLTWTAGPPPDDGFHGWQALSIAQENRLFVRTAWGWIREHPGEFASLLPRKLARLYGLAQADGDAVGAPWPAAVLYGVMLGAAAAGALLCRRAWRQLSMLLLLIVFTNLTTLVFSGASRYLIPMVPALAVLGGAATAWAERGLLRAAHLARVPVGT